jgi:hypothetical protein
MMTPYLGPIAAPFILVLLGSDHIILGQIIKGIDKIWLFGDIHTAVRFDQFL